MCVSEREWGGAEGEGVCESLSDICTQALISHAQKTKPRKKQFWDTIRQILIWAATFGWEDPLSPPPPTPPLTQFLLLAALRDSSW